MVVATFDSEHPSGQIIAGTAPGGEPASSSGSTTSESNPPSGSEAVSEEVNNGVKKVKDGFEEVKGEKVGSGVPDLKIVNRVGSIPLVADGIATFENVVNSTSITASLYSFGQGVAAKSLNIASPIISRGQPLLEKADEWANQGLDIAEDKFPYAFKTATRDIANDSVAVVNNRISPYLHNEIIQRAIDQIVALNQVLASSVIGAKEIIVNTTHSAGEQAHAISGQIVDQLHQLQTHGKDLPPMIYDSINKSFDDVKTIVADKDKTSQQKVNELVSYIQSIVQPALKDAGDYLSKTQSKAETQAGEIVDKTAKKAGDYQSATEKKASEVTDKANQASAELQDKADKTADDVQAKASQTADEVHDKAQEASS